MDDASRKAYERVGLQIARMMDGNAQSDAFARGNVVGVDADGYAWVSIDGSEPIPCVVESACKEGDLVTVRIEASGRAYTSGNVSDPAVNGNVVDGIANRVDDLRVGLEAAVADTAQASIAASEAAAVANATNQHFWSDDSGAHVTDETQDEWAEAAAGGFADLSDSKNHWNSLWNSLGMLFRRALNNLVSITRSAVAFYDGEGNEAENITASFGKDGYQVGRDDESHLIGDYHSLQLVDKEGDTYFHVSDLRDSSGYATIVERDENPDDGSHEIQTVFPPRSVATTTVILDDEIEATVTSVRTVQGGGVVVIAEELQEFIPVEVTYQTDSQNTKALTFGTRASGHEVGAYSTALGIGNAASGPNSVAAGKNNIVSAQNAAALGSGNDVRRKACAAIGNHNFVSGDNAAAFGSHLAVVGANQIAIGQYNIEDRPGAYLLIVGNGTGENALSNAMTLDWSGNAWVAGDVTDGGGNVLSDKADASSLGALASKDSLAESDIPSLPASKITSGTFAAARIPSLAISKITDLQSTLDDKLEANSTDASALINALPSATGTPQDADYFIGQYAGGGTTNTAYRRKPLSSLWTWIQGKLQGFVATLSGGTALTSSDDLDDLLDIGTYYISGSSNTPANGPSSSMVGKVIVSIPHGVSNSNIRAQEYIAYSTGRRYWRKYESGAWNSWQRHPIDSDFTPTQYNVKSLITQSSTQSGNFTVDSATLWVSGYTAQIEVAFKVNAALTAGTEYGIGTLGTAIRPVMRTVAGIGDRRAFADISAGVMYIRPEVAMSASTSTTYYLDATYILASRYTG